MPLKVESGTYTVNRRRPAGPAPQNKLSRFTLWRHWRRSVHEERPSLEEERRRGAAGLEEEEEAARRREVAGLAVAGAPGAQEERAPARVSRRSRPHSLAVQPLNYQRLDPERQLEEAPSGGGRPRAANPRPAAIASRANMTSQESIGSCSLDVERSASERSEVNAGSLSEKTLHSLSLSCNGEAATISEQQQQQPAVLVEAEEPGPASNANGHEATSGSSDTGPGGGDLDSGAEQQLTAATGKKPSYLGLACSISGYSGITRYDSKLREGFRSRDSSPGARLITRDTSPAPFRSNEALSLPAHNVPTKSQSISPLAMDRQQNGFANGVRDNRRSEYGPDSGRGINAGQGYSEVDRGLVTSHFNDGALSPLNSSSPKRSNRSPIGSRTAAYNHQNKSYSSLSTSSPKSHSVSQASYSESSILNGSADLSENGSSTLNSSASSEKSFIQQRVERLYGPGALAQGFFFKRGCGNRLDTSDNHNNKSSNNNNTSVDDSHAEQSLKNLPVLRHLRPEFRAQLPVVSPRRPTDGTEQIIKPLKRISLSPGKNDAKELKSSPVIQENTATVDAQMTASVTSLTDQQPAAPKVVLPVLEPSPSLTNASKQGAEKVPEKVLEKDGHYFMSLLNKERDRLIKLAEGAESELSEDSQTSLPEDAAGRLRSAAGKARLLASQKMKQFEGLCQKNINQVPGEEFPTTSEDLAGFWDMVMLQVVQVNDLFEYLDRLKKSQWQDVSCEKKSTPSTPLNGNATKRRQTPTSKVKASDNEAARKAREAREATRKQLIEERRRAMRANANKSDNSVEIFVPET